MPLNVVDPKAMADDDITIWTATTPPETIADDDLLTEQDPLAHHQPAPPLLIPHPKSTFIIRAASSGKVLTLLDGRVLLTAPGSRGSIHWACVETKGWLGFRNTVSGRFLGHDDKGRLKCGAGKQQGWENFTVRMLPEGGCVLQMTHWEHLWAVTVKADGGGEHLCKMGEGVGKGTVWEFLKVE